MHARTPGSCNHTYMRVTLGTAELNYCTECDWWWIQPSLAFAEPSPQKSDQRQRNTDRHVDEQDLVAGAERDAREFYSKPMGRHRSTVTE